MAYDYELKKPIHTKTITNIPNNQTGSEYNTIEIEWLRERACKLM